jgi:hypothetical protein
MPDADAPAPDDVPDDAAPETHDATPVAPAWRPSPAWFAAEITVVVVGVLIALALNAWWAGRQDAAQEATYLRQLAADLRATERQAVRTDSASVQSERATGQLLRAYYRPRVPPADSVQRWLVESVSYNSVRPVLGTLEALVATGDLGLVRDDSLRSAVTAYLDFSREALTTHERFASKWNARVDALLRRFDLAASLRAGLPPALIDSLARADPLFYLPAGPQRPLPPFDPEAFVRDDALRGLFFNMTVDRDNMRRARRQMRQEARALREQVEAELARLRP